MKLARVAAEHPRLADQVRRLLPALERLADLNVLEELESKKPAAR